MKACGLLVAVFLLASTCSTLPFSKHELDNTALEDRFASVFPWEQAAPFSFSKLKPSNPDNGRSLPYRLEENDVTNAEMALEEEEKGPREELELSGLREKRESQQRANRRHEDKGRTTPKIPTTKSPPTKKTPSQASQRKASQKKSNTPKTKPQRSSLKPEFSTAPPENAGPSPTRSSHAVTTQSPSQMTRKLPPVTRPSHFTPVAG